MPKRAELIVRGILTTIYRNGLDLSDIQLMPDTVPFIRGFVAPNVDVNAFYPISNVGAITEEDIKEFLFEYINDAQATTLLQEKQLSFRMELRDTQNSILGAFRVTAYYQKEKISLALRILKTRIPTPEQLHLPPLVQSYIRNNNYGLVMITGSTGSGKTTTAVALLKDKLLHHKNHGVLHLVTIESPIEYEFLVKPTEGIVEQREVGIDTPSYPAATRDVVRINPNIIFVGEVRDPVTAENCLQMATTGHLVVTTFHASSVVEAIARFRSMLPVKEDVSMFSSSLIAVTNQHLNTFKGTTQSYVFPVVEALYNEESIRELIISDRLIEVKNYMRSSEKCLTAEKSEEYIRQLIDEMEEEELIRKPQPPPIPPTTT